jgi:UDP-glucose 4-epimerase
MKIFLTGTGSFIGGELLKLCDRRGIQVSGVDMAVVDRPDSVVADIRSPEIADLIPQDVDAVVHLAALSRDPDCRDRAHDCFDINVMGTLNLMEAAKRRGAKQFIFASSEWVYDVFPPGVPKTEDDPINPALLTSEYALSKLVSECNLRQKFIHGTCPTTVLRFGIVYGPRAANWSAAESLLNAVGNKNEISVGALATARGFIHVTDIAEGILAALGLPGFEIVNLQGPRSASLGEVIAVSKSLLGRDPAISETAPDKPSIRLVSGEKAARLIKWRPRIELHEGLATVASFLGLLPA